MAGTRVTNLNRKSPKGRASTIQPCLAAAYSRENDTNPSKSATDAPLTVAAQGEGRATYVFRDVSVADLDGLMSFSREYAAAKRGWIVDALPLGDLRFKLVTRVPAMINDPS